MSFKEGLTKIDTQTFYGTSVTTKDEHNNSCPNGNESHRNFANACFNRYSLSVTAPAGWTFQGDPWVNCVRDNDGAFGWNNFAGAHDRFYVTQRNSNSIVATVWAGSRSMEINLACTAISD